jgi:hypothetical protein
MVSLYLSASEPCKTEGGMRDDDHCVAWLQVVVDIAHSCVVFPLHCGRCSQLSGVFARACSYDMANSGDISFVAAGTAASVSYMEMQHGGYAHTGLLRTQPGVPVVYLKHRVISVM